MPNINELQTLQKRLGYQFKKLDLLQIAATHKSARGESNNERLEFLGDALLDLIVAEELFILFPGCPEGDLTKLRASLVSESSLARMAKYIEIGEILLLSNSEERNRGRTKPSILSNAFEAIFGAIYLDGGLKPAKTCALKILHICFDPITADLMLGDHKTRLQEFTQARFGTIPQYKVTKAEGPAHKRQFEIALYINGAEVSTGRGGSKKAAEREAAKAALMALEEEETDE